MRPDAEKMAVPGGSAHQINHRRVHKRRADRRERRAADPHRREAELSENQDPVEEDIRPDRRDRSRHRDPNALRRAQKRAHTDREHLKRIGKPDDPKVRTSDFGNLRLIRIDPHHQLRRGDRADCENQAYAHHKAQRHAVGAVYSIVVTRAPILGEKQHPAPHEAPVA